MWTKCLNDTLKNNKSNNKKNLKGHAGAMLQARQLGNELYVGVHSDEAIAFNKGPVVMNLNERVAAVEACKWSTGSVPGAPYVTDPKVMDDYGCRYVVHGDDITTDADGNDCYQIVKDANRFLVVKRTPNISTTDLVGRMLSTGTDHHILPLTPVSKNAEPGSELAELKNANPEHALLTEDSIERFKNYATGPDGKSSYSGVYIWQGKEDQPISSSSSSLIEVVAPSTKIASQLAGKSSTVYYVDGGFDLFFMGHIEFLKLVFKKAEEHARKRSAETGVEELPLIVVGIHDDATVNGTKGKSFPIMNLLERALCVLQCRYVHSVILGAPFNPTETFLKSLSPKIEVTKVLHGETPIETQGGELKDDEKNDPYEDAKRLGLFETVEAHPYQNLSSSSIVDRVLGHRKEYEERQRKKGWKSENEKKLEAKEKEGLK